MAYEIIVNDIDQESTSTGVCTVYEHTIGKEKHGIANYKELIQQGTILPVNPYLYTEYTYRQGVGHWPEPWTYSTTCFTHRGGPFFSWPESINELKEKCIVQMTRRFYEQANESDFNMAVSAAELGRSMDLIGSTASRLGTAFMALRRFNVPAAFRALGAGSGPHYRSLTRRAINARRQAYRSGDVTEGGLKFASGAWLEIKYGWKPLLGEVYAASEALGRAQVKSDPTVVRTRAAAKAETGLVESWTGTVKGNLRGKRKVSLRMTTYSRIDSPAARSAAGLGLTNPLSVAWELMPFSFVIDWFVPVGQYIDSLDATQGTKFMQGTFSWQISEKYSGAISSLYYGGEWYGMNLPIEVDSFSFERTVASGFPDAKKLLTPKGFTKKSGIDKAITGLALLKQVFF